MQHVINTLRAFAEVLLPIAVVVETGYLQRRAFPFDQRTLNRVNIYGLSPCLMFVMLLRMDIVSSAALRLTTHMLVVILAMCGIAWLVAIPLAAHATPTRRFYAGINIYEFRYLRIVSKPLRLGRNRISIRGNWVSRTNNVVANIRRISCIGRS